MSLAGNQFEVVVADPPWPFRDKGTRLAPSYAGDQRERAHYDVMTVEDICRAWQLLPRLCAPDAFLFLWAPHALVIDGTATRVARAWGFEPKQEIIWVKTAANGSPRIGGGHYARLATEPMLLCRRGRARVARRDMPNLIFAPRTRHSAKPDESYTYIEQLTGASRLLELYARRRYSERWTVWGNEAPASSAEVSA